MKRVLITIILFISLFSFSFVNAQIQTPIDGISISSSPNNPDHDEEVTVSLESFLFDLDSSSIVWLMNGKNIAQGIGIKEVKVKAPDIGKKNTISTIIKLNGGREIQKVISIKSGSIDLIWETYGYRPPFFKGKNSFAYQNDIKIIAIPHLSNDGISEINPKNLIYQWRKGDKYIEGASGYGKQSIIIKADELPRSIDIKLDVYSRDQSQSSVKYITLQPSKPSLLFYEIDPLYGIYYNKSIKNNINLNNSEVTIIASPFGFNTKDNSLIYNWSINNIERPELIKNSSITLKKINEKEGSSNIRLEIRNNSNILQWINSNFNINFNKKTEDTESITF